MVGVEVRFVPSVSIMEEWGPETAFNGESGGERTPIGAVVGEEWVSDDVN